MTDLEPYTGAANLPVLDDDGTALITRAVQQMQGAHQLAKALANTAWVPYQWRGKPDDVAAAIMYGACVGLEPMTALRGLYVVNGSPGMYAKMMVALLQSKGHEVWTEDETDDQVTVAGRRRGTQHVERDTWTIERAKKAGYVPETDPKTGKYKVNDKGKIVGNEKYLTDPRAMLYARAASNVCRRVAPDALAGLDQSVEELQTIQVESEIVRDQPPKRESAAALLGAGTLTTSEVPAEHQPINPAAANDPAKCDGNHAAPRCGDLHCWHDDEPESEPEPMINAGQQRKIGTLMREHGITEKDVALAFVGDVIGREVGSRKELTKDEATKVIDALDKRTGIDAVVQQAADAPAGDPGVHHDKGHPGDHPDGPIELTAWSPHCSVCEGDKAGETHYYGHNAAQEPEESCTYCEREAAWNGGGA